MRKRHIGWLLCLLSLLFLLAVLPCFYKALGLGITAEEGLKYSVPAMKASTSYSAEYVRDEEATFRAMEHLGNRWGTVAEVLFFLCVGIGVAGMRTLHAARKSA